MYELRILSHDFSTAILKKPRDSAPLMSHRIVSLREKELVFPNSIVACGYQNMDTGILEADLHGTIWLTTCLLNCVV